MVYKSKDINTSKYTEHIFDKSERFHLDSNSPVPLYHQMEQVILDRISGPDMVNRMVPPEVELMKVFGISRATVKRCLEGLVNEGLLERKRGVGTRVIKQKITEDLARLKGYTEEMESKNLRISSIVLFASIVTPDSYVQHRLNLKEGEKTLCIRRLRGTSEVFPVVLLHTEMPASLGISPEEDFSGSLYKLIEEKYRIPIVVADQVIEASKATPEQAKYLEVNAGDSVLVMERLTFSNNEQPIEWVKAVYRPDRYKYHIRLKR